VADGTFVWSSGEIALLYMLHMLPEAAFGRVCARFDLTLEALRAFGHESGRRVWPAIKNMLERGSATRELVQETVTHSVRRYCDTVLTKGWGEERELWEHLRRLGLEGGELFDGRLVSEAKREEFLRRLSNEGLPAGSVDRGTQGQ
jgi:triphosphoribosyl-dephospho-CoA synthetase